MESLQSICNGAAQSFNVLKQRIRLLSRMGTVESWLSTPKFQMGAVESISPGMLPRHTRKTFAGFKRSKKDLRAFDL
jgi:hypothetical protein